MNFKALFAAACVTTCCIGNDMPAAKAQSLSSAIDTFCVNMRRHANANGMSAAPGSPFATIVAAKANQSSAQYAQAWMVAKASSNSNCRNMY